MQDDARDYARRAGIGVAKLVHDKVRKAVADGRTDEADAVADWVAGVVAVCSEALEHIVRECAAEAEKRGASLDRRKMAEYAHLQMSAMINRFGEHDNADQTAHAAESPDVTK